MARLKPLKLLHAVTEGLRRSVDGDEGYSGLLMKNPLSDAWDSDLCREDTYDLPDLVAALEEHGDMPPKSWTRTKRAREVGVGRNCTRRRPNSGRSTHGRRNRPRGADTAARTAFRRSAHDVRGCERQTRRNGIPRPPRCRRSGHARLSRRTAPWS